MNQDQEHLKLLSIFHYVVGGIVALFSLFPIIHLVLGIIFVFAPEKANANMHTAPAAVGWLFMGVAGLMIVIGFTFAVLIALTGRSIARRKRYTFCLVMAALECLMVPFGTILGVFTIIVLVRDSVKQLFHAPALPA